MHHQVLRLPSQLALRHSVLVLPYILWQIPDIIVLQCYVKA